MPILHWFSVFAFGLLAITGCGSGSEDAVPVESWSYVGTWVHHDDAIQGDGPAKIIFTTNTLALYAREADPEPETSGPLTLEKDWTADGYHFFQCRIELSKEHFDAYIKAFMLLRVGGENQELGYSESVGGYPTESDLSGNNPVLTHQE